jgi:tRNA A-37 threonylcarbamoyl transferase component Bud32
VDHVVAELSAGARAPQDVVADILHHASWDRASIIRMHADLHRAHRDGRLTRPHLAELSQYIESWLFAMADDEADPTEELHPIPPAVVALDATRAAAAGTTADVGPGMVLRDRYVLGEQLARGGHSLVYRARDLRRDAGSGDAPDVAIKVLREDQRNSESSIARLRREFRQTQALRHSGVVRMFDLDCDRGVWFITMEWLEGESLRARLKRWSAQPLGIAESLRIASNCGEVLAAAHRRGTSHGDFKPANVLLEASGGIKVLDFGAACDVSPAPPEAVADATAIAHAATRSYASPEVLAGSPAGPRDDIYSLACVTCEMLTGRHPFGRLPANEARGRLLVVDRVPGLTPRQNAALAGGLAWAREERPPSVAAFLEALHDTSGDPVPAGLAARLRTSSLARALPWRFVGVLAALALVAFIAFAWLGTRDQHVVPVRATRDVPSAAAPRASAPTPQAGPTPEHDSIVRLPVVAAPTAGTPPTPLAAETAPLQTAESSQPVAPPPAPARIEAESTTIRISEGAPAAVVLLRRKGASSTPVSVSWKLVPGSALAGQDYPAGAKGTVRFLRGQSMRTIYVPLLNDDAPELEEFFTLVLTSRTADLGASGRITITILDDD